MYVWLKEPQRLKAILIARQDDRDAFLEALLFDKGLTVVDRIASVGEACGLRDLPQADLVVAVTSADDKDVLKGLAAFSEKFRIPVLAVTDSDLPEHIAALTGAGAHSVLCIGMTTDRVRAAATAAIAGYEKLAALERRAENAERSLSDRKLIERAKGILMQQRGISEGDAFRELQTSSMKRNEPLPKVAETIIAAKELLG